MIALVCEWGGDLSIGPTGDIGVALVQTEVQQRIIRRLLTNAGDYIWHINYGGGLGSYIGRPYSSALIEGTILAQLRYEALVAPNPSPTFQISQSTTASFPSTALTVRYQAAGTSANASVVMGLGA
jgi:hypothetical protein